MLSPRLWRCHPAVGVLEGCYICLWNHVPISNLHQAEIRFIPLCSYTLQWKVVPSQKVYIFFLSFSGGRIGTPFQVFTTIWSTVRFIVTYISFVIIFLICTLVPPIIIQYVSNFVIYRINEVKWTEWHCQVTCLNEEPKLNGVYFFYNGKPNKCWVQLLLG